MAAKRKSSEGGKTPDNEQPRKTRGRTLHKKALDAVELGIPLLVDWDRVLSVPKKNRNNDNAEGLASWIGVQSKQFIAIDVADFRIWNNTEKNKSTVDAYVKAIKVLRFLLIFWRLNIINHFFMVEWLVGSVHSQG